VSFRVKVIPDEDGRAQPFRLTNEGRKLIEKAGPAWRNAQGQAKTLLGEEIVDQLGQAVGRLKANTH